MDQSLEAQVWKLDFSWAKAPASARLLALAIARRSFQTGACYASHTYISAMTNLSKKTVHRQVEELEEHGWLTRVPAYRRDGGRSTDRMWLTLPAVTFEATAVSKEGIAEAEMAMDTMTNPLDTVSKPAPRSRGAPPQGGGEHPPTESGAFLSPKLNPMSESKQNAGEGPAAGVDVVDLESAVEMIWARASKTGRERSSRNQIRTGLRAAMGRGHKMETILRGLGGYYESRDATKVDPDTGEEGAFQRGAHVILASDRFMSFIPDAPKQPATKAESAARAMVGADGRPTRELQQLWMQLFSTGMAWNPERGPEPGRLGCVVDDDLQRAYGVEPFALADAPAAAAPAADPTQEPAPGDDNAGVFD